MYNAQQKKSEIKYKKRDNNVWDSINSNFSNVFFKLYNKT